jgi:hypothetical protein
VKINKTFLIEARRIWNDWILGLRPFVIVKTDEADAIFAAFIATSVEAGAWVRGTIIDRSKWPLHS